MAMKWYVLHTLTGKEFSVKKALENQLEADAEKRKYIGKVFIPTEKVAEVKDGEKRSPRESFFPDTSLLRWKLTTKAGMS